ncbi:MAG: hypothetical protein V3R90_16860 [Limibaculum sp.]
MRLRNRIEKLERGSAQVEVIIFREYLSEAEEDAFVQEHLRAKGLPPDTTVIRITAADAGA